MNESHFEDLLCQIDDGYPVTVPDSDDVAAHWSELLQEANHLAVKLGRTGELFEALCK